MPPISRPMPLKMKMRSLATTATDCRAILSPSPTRLAKLLPAVLARTNSSAMALRVGSNSLAMVRALAALLACRLNSCLLNFSASSAWAWVVVATSWPFSARSLSRGATSRKDLPNSSCVRRALLPSSAKPARALAVVCRATAGSWALRSAMLRPRALMASSASEPGLALFSAALNLTRLVPTVSRLVPVRRATFSRALMFSMLAPVASLRSLRRSMASVAPRMRPTKAPTVRVPARPARVLLRVLPTRLAWLSSRPRLLATLAKAPWVASVAVRRMPTSVLAMVPCPFNGCRFSCRFSRRVGWLAV